MTNTEAEMVAAYLGFAQQAAENFAKNPEASTFSLGEIAPGEMLAVRWGLSDDGVLVFTVADDPVINFRNLVRRYQK